MLLCFPERKAKEKLERDYIDYDSEILESVIKQILNDWENKRVDNSKWI